MRMPSYTCSVRVLLPRPLFRKLMARAILERTDLSTLVIRAVRSDLPKVDRAVTGMGKGPGNG
jgi:hypothetical protein